MSPASKSKSKKPSTRATNEQQKVPLKSSNLHANAGKSVPTSAYNPALGTFHAIEISTSAPSLTLQKNSQSITIDETEEHPLSSPGTAGDYDSLSNNDSCSGESEDQKDKATTSSAPCSDSIPVPGSDADKRDKIRQKNERKHQRQREKRAQELHMRCSGFLKVRKLEALAQQLVAMGFPSDHSTAALIVNEGRMEDSVAWLLQEGEENNEHVVPSPVDGGAHIKIDISDELAKIATLEIKYKCSRREIERAVVACEGDLDKADENLKAQTQELAASSGKLEETASEPSEWNDKLRMASGQNPMVRSQAKGVASVSIQQQQRISGRDLNSAKPLVTRAVFQESVGRKLQSLRTQQMPDWVRAQVAAAEAIEKRWPRTSSNPSISHPLGSTTSDSRYPVLNSEAKTNLQSASLRDAFAIQHPQVIINAKQSTPSTSIGVSPSTGWYSNGISSMEIMASNANVGHDFPGIDLSGSSPPRFYPRSHVQSFVSSPLDSTSARDSGSWNLTGNSSVSSFAPASSLVAPASLGLFSDWGSLGSSSSVGSGGALSQHDYSSIDWSLDLEQLRPSVKGDWRLSDAWSTMIMGGKAKSRSVANGIYIPGLQDSSSLMVKPSAAAASREWTTPFAGKDLFGVSRRQFVASPSL